MIVQVASPSDPRVGPMLRLAHASFGPETLETDDQLLKEIAGDRPGDMRYFVWDEDGFRGFCRAAWLSVGILIVHIAVDRAFRGHGVGSGLLRFVRELSPGAPVFAEVEAGRAADWWRGQGATIVSSTYAQPALRPDTGPVPLTLVAIGSVPDPQAAIETIYREFYGRREGDPLVIAALEGVPA